MGIELSAISSYSLHDIVALFSEPTEVTLLISSNMYNIVTKKSSSEFSSMHGYQSPSVTVVVYFLFTS